MHKSCLRPNFSKPTQEKPRKIGLDFLGFSWIPSSESGLFKGLRAIQRKKFTPGEAGAAHAAIGVSRSLRGCFSFSADPSNLAFSPAERFI